jgi:hypothetical protein
MHFFPVTILHFSSLIKFLSCLILCFGFTFTFLPFFLRVSRFPTLWCAAVIEIDTKLLTQANKYLQVLTIPDKPAGHYNVTKIKSHSRPNSCVYGVQYRQTQALLTTEPFTVPQDPLKCRAQGRERQQIRLHIGTGHLINITCQKQYLSHFLCRLHLWFMHYVRFFPFYPAASGVRKQQFGPGTVTDVPHESTSKNSSFCFHGFCMILSVNKNYILKKY